MPVVLVVDDEPLVRRVVHRVLDKAGHDVLLATSGTEALDLLRGGQPVDLIVSDVMMDDMVGPRFVAQAREICPDARVLFMSGETPENLPEVGLDKTRTAFLEKPFAREAFLEQVQTLLADRV
ncbi:MAG: response regulator [Alphaproteobacteria bacterium]|nr:response regulator [Alphaproteobacteria bacterium]